MSKFQQSNPSKHAGSPLPSDQDWLDQLNQSDADTVRCGKEALAHLSGDPTWPDWMNTGAALLVGRNSSMQAANRNSPQGRIYIERFGQWLKHYGFDVIDKADRARLVRCVENRAEIEEWRKSLPPCDRLRFNHPSTVLRHWQAARQPPKNRPKRSSTSELHENIALLSEENEQLKARLDKRDMDALIPDGEPKEIVRSLLKRWSPAKAEVVARTMLDIIAQEREAL